MRRFHSLFSSALACLLLLTPAACATTANAVSVHSRDITPHLLQRFPWQQDILPGIASVQLSAPELSLPGPHAELSVNIAMTLMGSQSTLGRATLASGLRLDTAQGALFLDQPRLLRFTQANGQPLTMEPTTAALLERALDDLAGQMPVYRLTPQQRLLAARVQNVRIDNGRLQFQLL